MLPADG